MPISEELTQFQNEDDFVKRFLIPLFRRMGFVIVANYHGKREFGKDLLIGEIDRFSHVRLHGVQAKFEASLGKEAMHGLIQQCDEAFVKPFKHPQTGQRQKISSFYAVTAGTVSDEARDLFFAALHSKHADNVRILEGKDLLALDRFASIGRMESAREILDGLLSESRFAQLTLKKVVSALAQIATGDGNGVIYPLARLRVNAAASFLARPVLFGNLDIDVVERFWTNASAFNQVLDQAGASPLHTVVSIKIPATRALKLCPELSKDAETIATLVQGAIAELGPLAAV